MTQPITIPARRGFRPLMVGAVAAGFAAAIFLAALHATDDPPDHHSATGAAKSMSRSALKPKSHRRRSAAPRDTIDSRRPSGEAITSELEQLVAGPEIDWHRLAQVYAATAGHLSEPERRILAARVGRTAGGVALPPNEIALLEGSLPSFYERVAFAHGLARALPVKQFEQASGLTDAFSEAAVRQLVLRTIGQRWADHDWQAAVAWAEDLPEGSVAEAAWSGILAEWAEAEPKEALKWANENDQPAVAAKAASKMARKMATSDPQAAAEFANELPPSIARTQALSYSLSRWAAKDRDGVIAWSKRNPDLVTQGIGLIAAAEAWAQTDATSAEQWISTWDDPAALAVREIAIAKVTEAPPSTSLSPAGSRQEDRGKGTK